MLISLAEEQLETLQALLEADAPRGDRLIDVRHCLATWSARAQYLQGEKCQRAILAVMTWLRYMLDTQFLQVKGEMRTLCALPNLFVDMARGTDCA